MAVIVKLTLLMFSISRCDLCQRSFTQKIHLRKHLEKHHPEVDFEYAMKDCGETTMKVEEIGDKNSVYEAEYEIIEEEEEVKWTKL